MKAPPTLVFHTSESNTDEVVDHWDSAKAIKRKEISNNVSDLLNWISDVTIKRRKFRKRSRCSNLLAEAVLSNTLRNARKDLATKQEEKRKKAQEFSYQLHIKLSKDNYNYSGDQENHIINSSTQRFNSSPNSNSNFDHLSENNQQMDYSSSSDETVQDCISSLDNFFSNLKSIKV